MLQDQLSATVLQPKRYIYSKQFTIYIIPHPSSALTQFVAVPCLVCVRERCKLLEHLLLNEKCSVIATFAIAFIINLSLVLFFL